jgi:predicted pyridoxine 5'-phosphate oxidase superfamily flavin-nucleotide-binding protein
MPASEGGGTIPSRSQHCSGGQPMPAEAREMVARVALAYVATVSPEGLPNLSPKGSLKVVDDYTLAFGDIASPGTMRNLEHQPYVDINVLDVFRRRGYRFRGPAQVVDDVELIAFLAADLGAEYPIRNAVRFSVEETRPLISPIYWVTDTTEDDVIRIWEDRLGYRRAAAQAMPASQRGTASEGGSPLG